jgi:hypothetical protein
MGFSSVDELKKAIVSGEQEIKDLEEMLEKSIGSVEAMAAELEARVKGLPPSAPLPPIDLSDTAPEAVL